MPLRRAALVLGLVLRLSLVLGTLAAHAQDAPPADSTHADSLHRPPVRTDTTETPDTSDVAWTRRLPDVSIERARPQTATVPASARLQVLDAAAIRQSGADALSDLLALRSAAFIKQYGADGLASLSLRGMGASQTLVLLDGMRLSDPQTGQVDLALLPTVMLESVAVEHGAGSARYGSGSLGGTVHLRTLRPSTQARLRAESGGAAFGTRHVSAVVSDGARTASGTWSGLVAGRGYTSDGDFPYTNRFLVPQRTVRRTGSETHVATLYGRSTWRAPRSSPGQPAHRWSVATWWTHAARGLPGPSSTRASGAQQTDRQGRLWVDGTVPVGGMPLRIQAHGTASALAFRDPATGIDQTTTTRTGTLSAWTTWPLRARGTLDTGLSLSRDDSSIAGGAQETTTAAFADAAATFGRLRVEPAFRFDARWSPATTVTAASPRLGLSLRPLPTDALRLNAVVARAFRLPTFNERYYVPGGRPDLRPEDGWSADIGVELQRSGTAWSARAEVTGFRSVLADKIVWQPGVVDEGVQVWRPANVSRVVTHGLEASVEGAARPTSSLTIRAGTVFTHTRAESRATPQAPAYGSQLPYVPQQQLKLWTGLAIHGATLGTSVRMVGARFYTTDESKYAAPYQVVDVTAGYARAVGGVTIGLSAQVDNLLGERYNVIRLYPMPPRHASVRLSVSLSAASPSP